MRVYLVAAVLLAGCDCKTECVSPSVAVRSSEMASLLSAGTMLVSRQDQVVGILKQHSGDIRDIADKVAAIQSSAEKTQEAVSAILTAQEAVQVESETANGKEVISSVEPPSDVQVVKADTSGGVHLEQWTATWCKFCPAAKVNAEAAAKLLGVKLIMIDYDLNKQHVTACKIESLPTLAIVRDGKSRRRLKNVQSVEAIVAAVEAVKGGDYASTAVSAPAPMSHSEMVSLHNSLHGPGSWTWPGNLADHLRDAHGVDTGTAMASMRKPQVVRSQPQSRMWTLFGWGSSCPSGKCPTSRRGR